MSSVHLTTLCLAAACLVRASPGQSVLYAFDGLHHNDSFGFSADSVGDVDADGTPDIGVGAAGESAGSARVYSGATGALLHEWLEPGTVERWFGSDITGAGDVDGDHHDDVLVGAQGNISSATAIPFVRVYSGASGAVLYELVGPTASRFGADLANLGDLDGDGLDEFATNAQNADFNGAKSGRVYVYSGALSSSLPLYVLDGATPNAHFGESLAACADIDGDGRRDLVIGAIGKVFVHSGIDGHLLHVVLGPPGVTGFGVAVAGLGDLDRDGAGDFAVGAPYYSNGSSDQGLARVYSGASASILYEEIGTVHDGFLGESVGAVGDVDRDGVPDFEISQPGSTSPEAWVRSGRDGSVLHHFTGPQYAGDDYIGYRSADCGDLDGDGVSEFLISEPGYAQSTFVHGGRVWVYRGTCGRVLAYCTAGTTSNGCVGSLSASGATSFVISASALEGDKPGLLFYGVSGPSSTSWGGSTSFLCVKAPTQRTKFTFPGGTSGQCDGALALDWNAYVAAHPQALGVPFSSGDIVCVQGWFRDPPAPKTTYLTDALQFTLCP